MGDAKETAEKSPFEKTDELIRKLYPNKSDAWYEAKLREVYVNMFVNTITRNQ